MLIWLSNITCSKWSLNFVCFVRQRTERSDSLWIASVIKRFSLYKPHRWRLNVNTIYSRNIAGKLVSSTKSHWHLDATYEACTNTNAFNIRRYQRLENKKNRIKKKWGEKWQHEKNFLFSIHLKAELSILYMCNVFECFSFLLLSSFSLEFPYAVMRFGTRHNSFTRCSILDRSGKSSKNFTRNLNSIFRLNALCHLNNLF